MTAISVSPSSVAPVDVIEAATYPAGGSFNAGEYIRLSTDLGKWIKGDAGTTTGRTAIALTTALYAGREVTGLHKGVLSLGAAALSSLAFDAAVYAGATGGLADVPTASGTFVVGYVIPAWGQAGTAGADKLLRVNL